MPIERQFTGADYNFRIEVEPCQSDTVRLQNQSQVSIFRDNVQINKIIERFVVPNRCVSVLVAALDAAYHDGKEEANNA